MHFFKFQAGYFGQVHASKKSAARLRDASSSNDLAVTLCVLMAQQRHGIVYDDSSALHTKLVGKLYDQVGKCTQNVSSSSWRSPVC